MQISSDATEAATKRLLRSSEETSGPFDVPKEEELQNYTTKLISATSKTLRRAGGVMPGPRAPAAADESFYEHTHS